MDAALLTALIMIGLTGLSTTFDSPRYLVVGVLGVGIGLTLASFVRARRWPWLATLLLTTAAFIALGTFLALPDQLADGWLPSWPALDQLLRLSVFGWKEVLTTQPPLAGDGPYLVLVFLLSMFAAAGGHEISRRTKRALPALISPVLLFVVVALLGTVDTSGVAARGLAFVALATGWVLLRWQRRERVATPKEPTMANGRQRLVAVALVVISLATALGTGAHVPGWVNTRLVLRTYVQPPFDIQQYVSPLTGFRQYGAGVQRLWNQNLLDVSGAEPGTLLRIAVLDNYDGLVWSASPATTGGEQSGAFPRVGSRIGGRSEVGDRVVKITVEAAYANSPDLQPWLPGLGPAAQITFAGPDARQHAESFRYNIGTDQGVVSDLLQAGDTINLVTAVQPRDPGRDPQPYADLELDEQEDAFVAPAADRWSGQSDSAWTQLMSVADHLRQGYWSDGTRPGEGFYLPGHGVGRLQTFLNSSLSLVGSDEHYAAAFALIGNYLGIPTRVVFGARVPAGGMVRGQDIHAWVEARVADGRWITIPPERFTPPSDRHPPKPKEPRSSDSPAPLVPPPNALKPPGDLDALLATRPAVSTIKPPAPGLLSRIPPNVRLALAYIGGAVILLGAYVGAVLGLKAARAYRRRTRGSPRMQIAGGWTEILDRLRDLGHRPRIGATRREQSLAVGLPVLVELAAQADLATFGPEEPTAVRAGEFWHDIPAARRSMRETATRRRRILGAVSPRSLLHRW